jgi:Spy/CpxP family protein refolding chaperone
MNELMRWRMFAYMLALFIAGAISGAAVMSRMAAGSQTLKVGRTGEIEGIIKQKLILNLDLTPEQQAKFEPLVKKTSEELEASHLDCLKRVCDSLDKMHEQMKPDLTEEQRERMKQVEAERRASMLKKYNYPPETAKAGGH